MQKRNILNSPKLLELKRRKRQILIRKIIIFAVLFLILIAALSFISKISRLNIQEVTVSGNKVIDTERVQALVQRDTAGKYLWLFPKTNIFLYPKGRIQRDLANEFKRFKDIELSVQNTRVLTISVSERDPEYTWCGATPTAESDKEVCYFLDANGYIFDQAPYFSGAVYFKFYGETSGVSDTPAGSYVAEGYFDRLISFKKTLEDMSLKPVAASIENSGDIKIFLSRNSALLSNPQIIIKKDSDFGKATENFKAALDTEPLKSKFKTGYSALEYVDLRFGNKIYFK